MASLTDDGSSNTTNRKKRNYSDVKRSPPLLMAPNQQQLNHPTSPNPQHGNPLSRIDSLGSATSDSIQPTKKKTRLEEHASSLSLLSPQPSSLSSTPKTEGAVTANLFSFSQPDSDHQPFQAAYNLKPTAAVTLIPEPNDVVLETGFFLRRPNILLNLNRYSIQFQNSTNELMRLRIVEDFLRELNHIPYDDPKNNSNNCGNNSNDNKRRFLVPCGRGYQEAGEIQLRNFVSHQLRSTAKPLQPGYQLKMNPYLQGYQSKADPYFVCFSKSKKQLITSSPFLKENPYSFIAPFASYCQSQQFIDFCQNCQFLDVHFHLVLKDALLRRFVRAVADGSSCDEDQRIGVVFHGTASQNVAPILQQGLDPILRRRQAHGPGEYFSTHPSESLRFTGRSFQMLVFAVVIPAYHQINYDFSDIRTKHRHRAVHPVVVENTLHQLPLGMISWEDTIRDRSRRHHSDRRAQRNEFRTKLIKILQTTANRARSTSKHNK